MGLDEEAFRVRNLGSIPLAVGGKARTRSPSRAPARVWPGPALATTLLSLTLSETTPTTSTGPRYWKPGPRARASCPRQLSAHNHQCQTLLLEPFCEFKKSGSLITISQSLNPALNCGDTLMLLLLEEDPESSMRTAAKAHTEICGMGLCEAVF
jgi:hypothetical protein